MLLEIVANNYTAYVGKDYPQTWDIGSSVRKVSRFNEPTIHYAVDDDAQWNSTLPLGSGMIHLGPERRPFSISLFHQLRCLDILRREIHARTKAGDKASQASELSSHCMNYLRQMILCRADTRLEPGRHHYGPHITGWTITGTCNDYEAVFSAANRNYEETRLAGDLVERMGV